MGFWIRIRIRNADSDPVPEGGKSAQKRRPEKNLKIRIFYAVTF
jgi:hypothetical protein